jgi:hypothetical protein
MKYSYINLDYEFKLTILDKLKCSFSIFFDDEIQIADNSISSSINFEIVIESSFKDTNGNTKIFSINYNEFN